jgi:hypothetical protein
MDDVVKQLWEEYRAWALTSRAEKAGRDARRRLVLSLTIGGAFLATLSQQLPLWFDLGAGGAAWAPRIVGGVGAFVIAAAAFLTRSLLAADSLKVPVMTRAFAERLKREVFLYLTGVHDKEAAKAAIRDIADQAQRAGLVRSAQPDQKGPPAPAPRMSWALYEKARLDDQIKYFRETAPKEKASADGARWVMVAATIIALALSVGLIADVVEGAAVWASVITSAASAFWASHASGKHDYLSITYDAMATRLALYKLESPSGAEAERAIVQQVEDLLAAENDAWMAELTSRAPPPAPPGTVPSTG